MVFTFVALADVAAGCRFGYFIQPVPAVMKGILESCFPARYIIADRLVTDALPLLLLRSNLQDCSSPVLLSRRFLQELCAVLSS